MALQRVDIAQRLDQPARAFVRFGRRARISRAGQPPLFGRPRPRGAAGFGFAIARLRHVSGTTLGDRYEHIDFELLVAARDAAVRRFVYATSSSVYGDDPLLPKVEERTGNPLSPYAVSKVANELYAGVFERSYGLRTVGLRYFNVFGRRQDPDGPYAAVIPRWIANLLAGEPCLIHGDGETSRDFCYVENNVQANLLAALAEGS